MMYKIISILIITWLAMMDQVCACHEVVMPTKNLQLLWRPAYVKPIYTSRILICIGVGDEGSGYVLYNYDSFLDPMIDSAGGYWYVKP